MSDDEDLGPFSGTPPWMAREERLQGRPLTPDEKQAVLEARYGEYKKPGLRKAAMRQAIWGISGKPPHKSDP